MSELTVTKANFESEVANSEIPVLIDFWASWCGPCKMIAPIVSELAEAYEGRIRVGKVNVDDEQELAMTFQVSSIPTLIMFKDGRAVTGLVGARPKSMIESMINSVL